MASRSSSGTPNSLAAAMAIWRGSARLRDTRYGHQAAGVGLAALEGLQDRVLGRDPVLHQAPWQAGQGGCGGADGHRSFYARAKSLKVEVKRIEGVVLLTWPADATEQASQFRHNFAGNRGYPGDAPKKRRGAQPCGRAFLRSSDVAADGDCSDCYGRQDDGRYWSGTRRGARSRGGATAGGADQRRVGRLRCS